MGGQDHEEEVLAEFGAWLEGEGWDADVKPVNTDIDKVAFSVRLSELDAKGSFIRGSKVGRGVEAFGFGRMVKGKPHTLVASGYLYLGYDVYVRRCDVVGVEANIAGAPSNETAMLLAGDPISGNTLFRAGIPQRDLRVGVMQEIIFGGDDPPVFLVKVGQKQTCDESMDNTFLEAALAHPDTKIYEVRGEEMCRARLWCFPADPQTPLCPFTQLHMALTLKVKPLESDGELGECTKDLGLAETFLGTARGLKAQVLLAKRANHVHGDGLTTFPMSTTGHGWVNVRGHQPLQRLLDDSEFNSIALAALGMFPVRGCVYSSGKYSSHAHPSRLKSQQQLSNLSSGQVITVSNATKLNKTHEKVLKEGICAKSMDSIRFELVFKAGDDGGGDDGGGGCHCGTDTINVMREVVVEFAKALLLRLDWSLVPLCEHVEDIAKAITLTKETLDNKDVVPNANKIPVCVKVQQLATTHMLFDVNANGARAKHEKAFRNGEWVESVWFPQKGKKVVENAKKRKKAEAEKAEEREAKKVRTRKYMASQAKAYGREEKTDKEKAAIAKEAAAKKLASRQAAVEREIRRQEELERQKSDGSWSKLWARSDKQAPPSSSSANPFHRRTVVPEGGSKRKAADALRR